MLPADISVDPDAPFDIRIDCGRHHLEMTFRGEWDDDTFADFAKAYLAATEEMNACGGIAYSLVDTTGYGDLTPGLLDKFPALIDAGRPTCQRRTALVTRALVNQAQSRTVTEVLNVRHFRTVDAARDWLFSDEA